MARPSKNTEPAEEVKSSNDPGVKLRYTVKTPSGVYTVKRPVGRAGVVHFTLVSKAIPTSVDPESGQVVVSPADQERFEKAFVEWTEKVLPAIYVDGPTTVQDMPGEDQYALFLAMFTTVNLGGSDLFRFVE
jgi:hypothetical protein